MPYLVLLGSALVVLLIWTGRRPARASNSARIAAGLFAALSAVAAVVSALRGGWIASLLLIGLSTGLARTARLGAAAPRSAPQGGMTAEAARALLGVTADSGRAEIVAAYRRLMQRAHPDHGGTTGLAAQLNAARDRLLGKGWRGHNL